MSVTFDELIKPRLCGRPWCHKLSQTYIDRDGFARCAECEAIRGHRRGLTVKPFGPQVLRPSARTLRRRARAVAAIESGRKSYNQIRAEENAS